MSEHRKQSLLFHVCCAPCSGFLSQKLKDRFDLTIYFDNPNIWPEEEFVRRAEEAMKFFNSQGAYFVITGWDYDEWNKLAKGLEKEKEKGRRCQLCYRYRLENAAQFAAQNNFDYFTTSLLVSPWKDDGSIRDLGFELAAKYGIEFLADNFQADNGFEKSRDFAKEKNFYRQKYCGCEFSLKNGIL
jgi:predicted adenine nucleotide alpha hydrolase (AANH) superfamily ATPase